MFKFLQPRPLRQYVDAGRVNCPRRHGDVEIDACSTCRWMEEIELGTAQPFVRCNPPEVTAPSPAELGR